MRRILKSALLSLVLIFILSAATFFSLGYLLSPQDKLTPADAIVAISGGETATRAEEASRLYLSGWAPKLIFSGAASDTTHISNAAAMRTIAIKNGVPPGDILIEEQSENTIQNAELTKPYLDQLGIKSIILVTSPYHQRRADLTFNHILGRNVKIISHSSTDQNWRRFGWWQTDYGRSVTLSEAGKVLFLITSRRYQ